MLVGEVGIEPTMYLTCLIYSQMSSPARHTRRNVFCFNLWLADKMGLRLVVEVGVEPTTFNF